MKIGQVVKLGNFRTPENKEISGKDATIVSWESGGSGGHVMVKVTGHQSKIFKDGNFMIHRHNIK